MKLNNNIIFSGNPKEFESVFILRKIKRIIMKRELPIILEEIDYLSEKSIELSMEYNINTIPFAIFKDRVFVYRDGIEEGKLEKDISDFMQI